LHIDGLHTYEASKHDYETWHKFVANDGVIIFHDTYSFPYTVGRMFNEIEGYYKHNFPHSAGLGVITKNRELYEDIKKAWPLDVGGRLVL